MCTSWRSVSSSVLVAQSFFTSTRFFTSIPHSTRRRHYMHQHLQDSNRFPRLLLSPSTCRRSRPLNPSSPNFWSVCLYLRVPLCLRAASSVTGQAPGTAARWRALVIEHPRRSSPASAEPPGGVRSPSSSTPVSAAPALAEHAFLQWLLLLWPPP